MDEGSLGATVDLRTARPFDYNKLVFITQAKANYNDLSSTVGPQLSGLIANMFDDGKFGALASVTTRDGSSSWGPGISIEGEKGLAAM